jgi:hypothetical protein
VGNLQAVQLPHLHKVISRLVTLLNCMALYDILVFIQAHFVFNIFHNLIPEMSSSSMSYIVQIISIYLTQIL